MANDLRVGVLFVDSVQLLDTAPVDLLGMLSTSYLQICKLPSSITSLGLSVSIVYISPLYNDKTKQPSFVECTANAALRVNRSLTSDDCAPGALDILLIPGPEPSFQISPELKSFVQNHFASEKTTVMTVCTGVLVAAQSGVLDGKKATGPRAMLLELRDKFKDVEWVDKRWAVHGNIWTSGGITNGLDMVADFIRQRYPGPLSECVCAMADVGDRGMDYPTSQLADTTWWIWQIFKAWIFGKRNKVD